MKTKSIAIWTITSYSRLDVNTVERQSKMKLSQLSETNIIQATFSVLDAVT